MKFFSFCAATVITAGFAACSNTANDTKTSTDSPAAASVTPAGSETGTATSSNNYAALADSVEANSAKGYYLNPKTGKAYKSLKVDRTTGAITDDAGEPVWRYVDNRNWWVYGDDNMDDTTYTWNHVNDAKMDNDKIMYKGDGDNWSDYDTRYKTEDENWIKKHKVSDGGAKHKIVTEDGDKMKVKTDEEGNTKIKVNGDKMKVDKDGNVKKD